VANTPVLRVEGLHELEALRRDLLQQADGRERTLALRRELREAARPMLLKVRSSILSTRSKNQNARRGRPSLRMEISKAATLEVRTARHPSVSVFINPRKMPDGKKALPEYYEGSPPYTRWRHPLFNNRDYWYMIQPKPYFTDEVRDAEIRASKACQTVIDQTARDLEG
jgi:hypothetical protein